MKFFDDYLAENINFFTAALALIILVEATFITSLFLPETTKVVLKEKITTGVIKQAQNSSLTILPATASSKVANSFEVSVNLDTGNAATIGTDLVISYDKNKLEIVDSDSTKAGSQIKEGNLYDKVATNEEKDGKIYFGAISSPGKPKFSGKGVIALIKFKAKEIGTAKVTIDFSPGNTKDSNVTSSDSKDILSKVGNGQYSLTP